MLDQINMRKEAYRYIMLKLNSLPSFSKINGGAAAFLPLEELRQLKEGLSDPSPTLIAQLSDLLKGNVSNLEIQKNLVEPFRGC